MIQYIFEIIIWTIILYTIIYMISKFIYRFIISPEKIRELKKLEVIKSKTKSENTKTN